MKLELTERSAVKMTAAQIRAGERGVSLAEMLVGFAIIGLISAITVLGITSARASFRLSGSARVFASFVEKARTDAIRRHATAQIKILNASTYRVEADFDGDGTVETRDVPLDTGVSFVTAPTTISFDWQGRTASDLQIKLKTSAEETTVEISSLGDNTIDQPTTLPSVTVNAVVSKTADINSDAIVSP